MADFSAPEYASYVALVRELALERDYQEGDWVYWTKDPGEFEVLVGWRPQEPGYVWLPQLADLLDMLEAAEHDVVVISGTSRNGYGASCCMDADGNCAHHGGTAPTREEACARLWVAVTGRTVNA